MVGGEYNFDGLVGPTHHYGGMGLGNLASQANRHRVSNPRKAALQGLAKMKRLMDLGVPQGFFPPRPVPDLELALRLGFKGRGADLIADVGRRQPGLLGVIYSAASMWSANAATVCPSCDSGDGRVHFTPANLISQLHRSRESEFTARVLRHIFPEHGGFVHHAPLPAQLRFADEGAANHTRFSSAPNRRGLHCFVYGRTSDEKHERGHSHPGPGFSPRQAEEASLAVARLHNLPDGRAFFVKQHPEAVSQGVFHNDVIAVGHRDFLLMHERSFAPGLCGEMVLDKLAQACGKDGFPLRIHRVPEKRISLSRCVSTYLFNSQLLTLADGKMVLVAPEDCREDSHVYHYLLHELIPATPIQEIVFVEVRESMRNGGGPACLRLRVELTREEADRIAPSFVLTEQKYVELGNWVKRNYREQLRFEDLADPSLMLECEQAFKELSKMLALP